MPRVGTLTYANTAKPYQVTMITPQGTAVPIREQKIAYTSFQRPARIDENQLSASFTYNAAGERVKMYVANGTAPVLTRYYIGKQYELDAQTNTERLYLGGDVYSAPAVYIKEGGNWKIYYICRDYLGSITQVANADGSLKQELSYDAWGRLRNPATQAAYAPGTEPALFLGRGYTGHEHLPWFGLINMNARLYDPVLGRFLSPDPYVQAPDFTQNFNRYSYCLNNPLVYVDEDGEFIHIIVGAVVGGVFNLVTNWKNIDNFGEGLASFVAGAGAGALYAVNPALGSTVGSALTAATNNIIQQTGNGVGLNQVNWSKVGTSGLIGAAVGGATFGVSKGYDATGIINSVLDATGIKNNIVRNIAGNTLNGGISGLVGGTIQGVMTPLFTGDWNMNTFFENIWKGGLYGLAGGFAYGTINEIGYQIQLREGRKEFLNSKVNEAVSNNIQEGVNQFKNISSNNTNQEGWSMSENGTGMGEIVVTHHLKINRTTVEIFVNPVYNWQPPSPYYYNSPGLKNLLRFFK